MFSGHNREIAHMNSQWPWPKRLVQAPGSQNSQHRGEKEGTIPPLADELLEFDSCWEKRTQFSLQVWPLVGCSVIGSTSKNFWTTQIGLLIGLKWERAQNWVGISVDVDLGVSLDESEYEYNLEIETPFLFLNENSELCCRIVCFVIIKYQAKAILFLTALN